MHGLIGRLRAAVRRLRGSRGQGTVEYVGIVLAVGALLLALATPMGQLAAPIAKKLASAVTQRSTTLTPGSRRRSDAPGPTHGGRALRRGRPRRRAPGVNAGPTCSTSGSRSVKRAPAARPVADRERAAHGRGQLGGDGQAEPRASVSLSETNGRKIVSRWSGGTPGPVSPTSTTARPPRATQPRPRRSRPSASSAARCRAGCRRSAGSDRRRRSTTGSAALATRSSMARARAASRRALRGACEQTVERDVLAVEREAPRLELGEVEQIADQALQAVGLGEHDLERRARARPGRR